MNTDDIITGETPIGKTSDCATTDSDKSAGSSAANSGRVSDSAAGKAADTTTKSATDIAQDSEKKKQRSSSRIFSLEILTIVIACLAAIVMVWMILSPTLNLIIMSIAGIVFTLSLIVIVRLLMDPDSVRARQSNVMLELSSATLNLMKDGMTKQAAQGVCELLLPNTAAIAVAITDKEYILGYAGFLESENPSGSLIRTQATHDAMADGEVRVLLHAEDIKFPSGDTTIKAAIIVPLWVGSSVAGSLKFYYRNAKKITETQKSIAQGFGELLSTQMAATEMETQRKLATSMELKMLQSQINPHFLFNTINTIASLIRTDPGKARTLLRDFAVFYRRTLEDSSERIMLSREIEQTMRYFSFEVARFGDERVALCLGVAPEVQDMLVPPFLIQPLVENAVRHAIPSEGRLTVTITAEIEGNDVLVTVMDDGVGMSEEACNNIMHPTSSTGMGIAVKNVHDRMIGFFGLDADMLVESTPGEGTSVTLRFPDCAILADSEKEHEPHNAAEAIQETPATPGAENVQVTYASQVAEAVPEAEATEETQATQEAQIEQLVESVMQSA